MLYVLESKKTVAEIEKQFPEVASRHKFGVLGTHDLRQKMREKGVEFDKECLVFEVCNPHQAKKVLDQDLGISTALPCRVSVYSEGGKTRIATIKPTALLEMFKSPALRSTAEEVERTLMEIMKDLQ